MIVYEYEPEILRTIDEPLDYLKSRSFTGNLPQKSASGQESEKGIDNDKELNQKTSPYKWDHKIEGFSANKY